MDQSRLGNCEVCDADEAQYTCPRCEVKSCSLRCANIHKRELDCNGARDRTVYKPLEKFSNIDIRNDYQLIEDVSRMVEKYSKDISKRWTRINNLLPVQLFKLRSAARVRGTNVFFMPQNFDRHKENTTHYNWKTHELHWRIEWSFIGNNGIVKYVDERVLDSEYLCRAVRKYLYPETHNESLMTYYASGLEGVCILLKAERTCERYYELDKSLTLRKNFENKLIVEFPYLHVILNHHRDSFDIIDPDEQEDCFQFCNANYVPMATSDCISAPDYISEETTVVEPNILYDTSKR